MKTTNQEIKHLIAQKDIPFSNSKIETFNKIIKHQFLLPQNLVNREQLEFSLIENIRIYNSIRPQLSLQGNTPAETFTGKPKALNSYKIHFQEQKISKISANQ